MLRSARPKRSLMAVSSPSTPPLTTCIATIRTPSLANCNDFSACCSIPGSFPGQAHMTLAPSAHIRSDARTILRLGGPLIANNLANAGMTFADTVMAGQLGARELAGLAVGVGFYTLCFIVGLGTLMALSPCVAHAYGARDD